MKRTIIAAVLGGMAAAAQAATYTVDLIGDPATTVAEDGILQTLATPLAVDVGDVIDFHVRFTGGAAIHPLRNLDEITVALLSGDHRQTEFTTSSFALTGAQGFAADHGGPFAESDCCIGLYGRYHPSYLRPFGRTSFTGFDAVVTLTGESPESAGGPVAAPRRYTTALFFIGSQTVPEPASWALLTLGFAGVGIAARRRRGTAA